MSDEKIIWTPEQVVKLNEFQTRGRMHPFTCETAHPQGRNLVATVTGWVCLYCDYRQYWAHEHMFRGAGVDPFAAFRKPSEGTEPAQSNQPAALSNPKSPSPVDVQGVEDIARQIASYAEGDARINVYKAALQALSASPQPADAGWLLSADQVEWVTNSVAELGVKIGNQFFFLYKGYSLVYHEAEHDDGSQMMWRPVFKREFGECAHPINYENPKMIGTVSLDDSDEWQPLPAAPQTGGEG